MRTLPDSDFLNHIAGEVTTLATCWKLSRRDGVVLGFTDYVDDLTYAGQLYQARSGFQPTSVQMRNDFSVDNLDIEGILESSEISEPDIQAGLYDYAELEVHLVNYADLTMSGILVKRGWIGEVRLQRGQFIAEVRGLAQKLSQNIGRIYTPTCDAILGDTRCGVDLGDFTGGSTVAAVTSNAAFTTTTPTTDNSYFKGGVLTWTSGNNDGLSMEVKEFIDSAVELALPMGQSVQPGDTFTVVAGCDKTRETCLGKFNNILNFRGFPDLPGQDKLFETSSTRTESDT
jgi:uncharacterized phage protein (TIGR02218 family)